MINDITLTVRGSVGAAGTSSLPFTRQSIHERGDRLCVRRRRENHARAAELLQFRRRIASIGINVMVRAQFSRQRFLVLASADRHGLESHLPRVLNTEMSQSADAVHGDHIAAARAGIAQRVVDRDARAHERPRFLRRQVVRNRRQRLSAGAIMYSA